MTARRRVRIALLVIIIAVTLTPGVGAYLRNGTRIGTKVVALKWTHQPIRYFVTNRDVPGVTAAQLQTALDQSFGAWSGVSTATIKTEFGGFTAVDPLTDSNVTVIGFQSRPDLEHVLGSTSYEVDTVTGELIASHIFLNSSFSWSVAANGQSGRFDVQSIATHEIGHLLGLSHSALGETDLVTGGRLVKGKKSIMFPVAFPPGTILDRKLNPDDIAGISDIYATSAFNQQFGQVVGKVTRAGAGVFGAHVTAFNSRTGAIVGGFSLSEQGDFVIGGLTPGLYTVRAEPLDDADINGFFDDEVVVNLNFKPAYYTKLVAVPAGGASASIEIKVPAK
jgi:hypothetical protein